MNLALRVVGWYAGLELMLRNVSKATENVREKKERNHKIYTGLTHFCLEKGMLVYM